MENLIRQFFNLDVMWQSLPLLLKGFAGTFILCLSIIPLGVLGGVAFALLSLSRHRAVRWSSVVVIDFFRAMPPIVLLIVIYAGLPFLGVRLGPYAAVCVAFALNTSSYYGEVFRAGIESVSPGQVEAARATGLSRSTTFLYVVLPQATRNVLPDLVSNTLEVVKLTSIASVVSLTELLFAANTARSVLFNPSPLVLASIMYLLILIPMVQILRRVERK